MLTRIGAATQRWLSQTNPWTNVYGLGRTLVSLSTALTLAVNPGGVLFPPLAGMAATPPLCSTALQRAGLFCLLPASALEWVRWTAVAILLLVASGWRPRVTALLHWWVTASFEFSATALDGGDQAAAILALLLIPVALTDSRKWHWSSAPHPAQGKLEDVRRLIANSAICVIRLQVAGIYFHAAVGKMMVREWLNGTAIYYWMSHPLFGLNEHLRAFLGPLLENGAMVWTITWGTMVLEVCLAMGLLATVETKRILLPLGVVFHLGIIIVHGLVSFAMVMWGALILFLRPVNHPFRFSLPSFSRERAGRPSTLRLNAVEGAQAPP